MKKQPSPNGSNGRDGMGKFLPGNRGGPGNPFASQVARLRAAFLAAVSEADIKAVVEGLVKQAKTGDVMAIRELLTRVLGKPAEAPCEVDRIQEHGSKVSADRISAEEDLNDKLLLYHL